MGDKPIAVLTAADVAFLRSLGVVLAFTEPLPLSSMERFQAVVGKLLGDDLVMRGDTGPVRYVVMKGGDRG